MEQFWTIFWPVVSAIAGAHLVVIPILKPFADKFLPGNTQKPGG